MKGKQYLYIDQYDQKYIASTIKELKEKISPYTKYPKVSKMYVDMKDGSTQHIGYIINGQWLRAYKPVYL